MASHAVFSVAVAVCELSTESKFEADQIRYDSVLSSKTATATETRL